MSDTPQPAMEKAPETKGYESISEALYDAIRGTIAITLDYLHFGLSQGIPTDNKERVYKSIDLIRTLQKSYQAGDEPALLKLADLARLLSGWKEDEMYQSLKGRRGMDGDHMWVVLEWQQGQQDK